MVVLLAIFPLSDSLNLASQNTYLLERLRFDHLFHGLLFLPVFGLIHKTVKKKTTMPRFFLSLFISLMFAVLAELIQIAIPYRAFTFADLQANIVGVLFGTFLFSILYPFRNYKKEVQ
jgi:VanZ family protein